MERGVRSGRIIIRKRGSEEPISARNNWTLWVLCRDFLTSNEIQFLITKRKNDLKYEKNPIKVRELRTDIRILEDAYYIIKRKEKEK